MKKMKLFFGMIAAAILFSSVQLHAYPMSVLEQNYLIRKVHNFYQYQGDRHGDFKDDWVVILDDNSEWKTHPTEQDMIMNWKEGEWIYIEKRPDDFWFKREHRFYLVNMDRDEKIKVMMVHSGSPVPITEVGTPIDVFSESYETTSTGETYQTWKRDYTHLPITLSDGSKWLVRDHTSWFRIGKRPYFIIGPDPDGIEDYSLYLISKKEREARCSPATMLQAGINDGPMY